MQDTQALTDKILSQISMNDIAALMRRVATQEIMSRFKKLKESDVREKTGPQDLVTTADTEAERVLTEALPKILPGSKVIGEEAVSKDPSLLRLLDEDAPLWILDPVDGTYYFKNEKEGFGLLAALTHKGRPILSFVVEPNLAKPDDANAQNVYMAAFGHGAYLNDYGRQPVRIAPAPQNDSDLTNVWIRVLPEDPTGRPQMKDMPQPIGHCRSTFGIGMEFVNMVKGTGPNSVGYDKCFITPWDFAAPYLLVTESGGAWLHNETGPYRAKKDNGYRFLAAQDARTARLIWSKLYPADRDVYEAPTPARPALSSSGGEKLAP